MAKEKIKPENCLVKVECGRCARTFFVPESNKDNTFHCPYCDGDSFYMLDPNAPKDSRASVVQMGGENWFDKLCDWFEDLFW